MRQLFGVQALQVWIARVVLEYQNIHLVDMSTSFRNGLVFCAIIHHFRPHLINYDTLRPDNRLAFDVAEAELGVPSLLDPEDMLEMRVPDRLSIITYVSQFYHLFKDEDDSRQALRQNNLQ